jgi:transcriptional regulator with XRE-family HTH domain
VPRPRPSPLRALGAAIRKRRAELGISQESLAHRAKLDRSYVGGVERGERNVAYVNILKLARALDLSAAELIAQAEKE